MIAPKAHWLQYVVEILATAISDLALANMHHSFITMSAHRLAYGGKVPSYFQVQSVEFEDNYGA